MFTLGLVQEHSLHDIYDVLFIEEIIYMIIKSMPLLEVNMAGLFNV